jgi:hypothetical protein
MHVCHRTLAKSLLIALLAYAGVNAYAVGPRIEGEQLDPSAYGPSYVESWNAVVIRDQYTQRELPKGRRFANGVWTVPTRGSTYQPRSGEHYVINKWGDTRMGIGFPRPADVIGAAIGGQADEGVWTTGVQVIGYRDGEEVARTDWFREIGAKPAWFEIDLRNVDRIEFVADPVLNGSGWFAMDDFTFAPAGAAEDATARTVLDFDDLDYRTQLTGTNYGGLIWEEGQGFEQIDEGVPAPQEGPHPVPTQTRDGAQPSGTRAIAPNLIQAFQGVIRGDAGSNSYPPDTIGAIGPNHYVMTVNRNIAIYNKSNGAEQSNVLLGSFLPGSSGDPRVLYDQHSSRFIVLVTDFDDTLFLAVSRTSNPLGDWFKTSFNVSQGSDAGKWPDYPTLGVDENGVYTSAYMVSGGMSIFAIDKAPLVSGSPFLGTVTAFRGLPFEGAIQPCHTFGTGSGQYFVSTFDSDSLRIRRVNPPLTSPTLSEIGFVSVPTYFSPPNAPALGSSTPINTVGDRLMMAMYRNGAVWTAHTVDVNGRAGCRWYQISVPSATLIQSGTVADSSLHYYFPAIMVNEIGAVALGMSGSDSSQYVGCYYTGRLPNDPAGEMADPVQYKEGTGAQNNVDGFGRNRWGDYSYTTLDPSDGRTFWTAQEYGEDTNIWGTYIAELSLGFDDCNDNGIPDDCDISCNIPGKDCNIPGCGQSTDCNNNDIPDDCETSEDCNNNGVLDLCDIADGTSPDCNLNGVPDECDLTSGLSGDCNINGIPDECEVGGSTQVTTYPLDSNPGWATTGEWAFGQPTGQGGATYGNPDPTSGFTGDNVYGVNLNGDYDPTFGGPYHLTAGPFDLSLARSVELTFRRWLNSDYQPYVKASISASGDGQEWLEVWENASVLIRDDSWQAFTYDVSDAVDRSPNAYVRWSYDKLSGNAFPLSGWNIDDVELSGFFFGGGVGDCNNNVVPDECDILSGFSQDVNGNGVPDECEGPVACPGDCNCDGIINFQDIPYFKAALGDDVAGWQQFYRDQNGGQDPPCPFQNCNVDGSGGVNFQDIPALKAALGTACSK